MARRFIVTLALALALALLPASFLQADGEPVITLTAPAESVLGEPMQIVATLHDAGGVPIPDVSLDFLIRTEILNNRGLASIGSAVTDTGGVARLAYEPRQSGPLLLQVSFAGSETLDAVRVQLEIGVVGDQQLFVVTIGTDAPPFELWLLLGLLTSVWLLVISVTVRIYLIASQGGDEPPAESVPQHFRTREEWS